MKWTEPDSTEEKFTKIPSSSLTQRNSSLFYTSLLRYSMTKRRLSRDERNQTPKFTSSCAEKKRNFFSAIEHSKTKRMLNSISREELLSIQIKLAILSDADGDRPIHIAVANEDLKQVHKLCLLMLKNKISLDITNYLKQTPLHLAVMIGNIDIIQLLLNYGASPTVCDKNGNTVLHLCVKSHTHETVLHHLLKHEKIKGILNTLDYEGYCALHYAVFKNNTNAIKMLKDSEADMNQIDGKSGRTALIHAILEQNVEITELLLNSNANPQKTDYSGRSAFDMAFQITNVPITQLLEKWMPDNEKPTINVKKPITHQNAKIKRTRDLN